MHVIWSLGNIKTFPMKNAPLLLLTSLVLWPGGNCLQQFLACSPRNVLYTYTSIHMSVQQIWVCPMIWCDKHLCTQAWKSIVNEVCHAHGTAWGAWGKTLRRVKGLESGEAWVLIEEQVPSGITPAGLLRAAGWPRSSRWALRGSSYPFSVLNIFSAGLFPHFNTKPELPSLLGTPRRIPWMPMKGWHPLIQNLLAIL